MNTAALQSGLTEQQQVYVNAMNNAGVFPGLSERIAIELGGQADPPVTIDELNSLTDEQKKVVQQIVEHYESLQRQQPTPQPQPVQPQGIAQQTRYLPGVQAYSAADQRVLDWGNSAVRRDYAIFGGLCWFIVALVIGFFLARHGQDRELDRLYQIANQCQARSAEVAKP